MVINKIKLTNFRNYKEQEVDFGRNTNIILGKNAQGKTNLIEPIYILSTLKTFRNSKLVDCINEDENEAIIELFVESEVYGKRTIKMVIKKDGENEFFVNDNKITQKKNCFGFVYSVIFSPDELKLVKNSPDVRREFLDIDIMQISQVYHDLLERYEEILANRNKLLKENRYIKRNIDAELDIWDMQLALVGSKISFTRKNFVNKINSKINEIMKFLTKGQEELIVKYITIPGKTREDKTKNFEQQLLEARERDKELGYTSVGPHRDDLKFYINNKEVKPYASQGQIRSVVLALKLAELETLKEEKECPVILLDDVFSELDGSRQFLLLKYLEDEQVFITSTFARTKGLENYKKFKVTFGNVKEDKK